MQVHSCSPLCCPNLPFRSQRIRHQSAAAAAAPRKPSPPPSFKPLLSSPLSPPSHIHLSSSIDDFIRAPDTQEPELELLGKPSPIAIPDDDPKKPPELEEALAPFLKLFRAEESDSTDAIDSVSDEELESAQPIERVNVEYYDAKAGDLVVGVVVSGNENRLDVSVGADMLGTMLTKEVLPLYGEELPHVLCDLGDPGEFVAPGKIGVVKDEEALGGKAAPGRPVVEVGTVLFAEVLGRTLSGRPLLSTRRMFRRVAWHRVRQIKQLNEPIEVRIFEWNTGGLLTRIEGLRAFLPKAELMNRVNNYKDLKDNVGRRITVCISRIDEVTNDLIISEKEAWDMLYLKEGTLLEGTVLKIFPYGAQVRIGESNRSGLLHISNISRARVTSINDLLTVDEKVKALVVKSLFPEKISLSIADLESEPGLFLSDKEKVFSEAKEMARKYKQRLPVVSAIHKSDPLPNDILPFDDESRLYANWQWFEFERCEDTEHNENTITRQHCRSILKAILIPCRNEAQDILLF